jgi:hypothetical protein
MAYPSLYYCYVPFSFTFSPLLSSHLISPPDLLLRLPSSLLSPLSSLPGDLRENKLFYCMFAAQITSMIAACMGASCKQLILQWTSAG